MILNIFLTYPNDTGCHLEVSSAILFICYPSVNVDFLIFTDISNYFYRVIFNIPSGPKLIYFVIKHKKIWSTIWSHILKAMLLWVISNNDIIDTDNLIYFTLVVSFDSTFYFIQLILPEWIFISFSWINFRILYSFIVIYEWMMIIVSTVKKSKHNYNLWEFITIKYKIYIKMWHS